MTSLPYEVKAHDLASFVFASMVFLLIGMGATYLPARQATNVDPSRVVEE
jgi:ABC-type lipoprotein release transport system permease subunit